MPKPTDQTHNQQVADLLNALRKKEKLDKERVLEEEQQAEKQQLIDQINQLLTQLKLTQKAEETSADELIQMVQAKYSTALKPIEVDIQTPSLDVFKLIIDDYNNSFKDNGQYKSNYAEPEVTRAEDSAIQSVKLTFPSHEAAIKFLMEQAQKGRSFAIVYPANETGKPIAETKNGQLCRPGTENPYTQKELLARLKAVDIKQELQDTKKTSSEQQKEHVSPSPNPLLK